MSRPSVVITGFGAVTPIGVGRDAFETGLRSGACGVGTVSRFDASAYRSQAAAELLEDVRTPAIRAAAEASGLPLISTHGRAALYALASLAEALEQAGLTVSDLQSMACGFAFGGSTAGMSEAEDGLLALDPEADYWAEADPEVFLTTPVGSTADVVVHAAGIGGPVTTISTACSSATNAVGQALDWIRAGHCDRVIALGSDAHCKLTHAGFCSLQLVAPERPRPFDARRAGMCIGEGAAAFVLEREDLARARGATIHGRILGFGNVAEAHHLVQPRDDGDGAARAMWAALEDAGIEPSRVDYISAHGTATVQNDASEAAGIHQVFGARATRLPVSSTKSQVGHLLGASGAVELAAVLLGMRGGFFPPNVGWEEQDPEIDLDLVLGTARDGCLGIALSNSFAFGGNDSSLCIGHPDQGALG